MHSPVKNSQFGPLAKYNPRSEVRFNPSERKRCTYANGLAWSLARESFLDLYLHRRNGVTVGFRAVRLCFAMLLIRCKKNNIETDFTSNNINIKKFSFEL
ncbi:hypothetical protein GWI33_005362 [Rhynchophorus ferrugineus]|uniref:Uncharacterized protein n=1 Tax=Rhynchophorus ferrugineus TaxID=354439 RepID=A0A834IU51_RHYFE|nr:hypothetical protein GWI33_005362 [Rhynchophorus ferrugineus]